MISALSPDDPEPAGETKIPVFGLDTYFQATVSVTDADNNIVTPITMDMEYLAYADDSGKYYNVAWFVPTKTGLISVTAEEDADVGFGFVHSDGTFTTASVTETGAIAITDDTIAVFIADYYEE